METIGRFVCPHGFDEWRRWPDQGSLLARAGGVTCNWQTLLPTGPGAGCRAGRGVGRGEEKRVHQTVLFYLSLFISLGFLSSKLGRQNSK